MERSIHDCLSRACLKHADFDVLMSRLRDWREERQPSLPSQNVAQLRLAAVKDRLIRLTDALIDRLIDKDAFNERKAALLLEEAAINEEIAEWASRTADPGRIERFLELLKSLEDTFISATRAEKYEIAKIATSNRTVTGKDAYLEPANWLIEVGQTVSALCGALAPDTDRTLVEHLAKQAADWDWTRAPSHWRFEPDTN